jgi:hypothetical protein
MKGVQPIELHVPLYWTGWWVADDHHARNAHARRRPTAQGDQLAGQPSRTQYGHASRISFVPVFRKNLGAAARRTITQIGRYRQMRQGRRPRRGWGLLTVRSIAEPRTSPAVPLPAYELLRLSFAAAAA